MADAPDLSVKQDTASGPGNDLPQGAASQVNAALPTQTVSEGQTITAPEPSAGGGSAQGSDAAAEDTSEPELAQPSDYEPVYTPESDDEQFITGPTTRPDESVSTGAFVRAPMSLSPRLAAAMPTFVAAAELPDAPPQLRLLMALLSSDAEQ